MASTDHKIRISATADMNDVERAFSRLKDSAKQLNHVTTSAGRSGGAFSGKQAGAFDFFGGRYSKASKDFDSAIQKHQRAISDLIQKSRQASKAEQQAIQQEIRDRQKLLYTTVEQRKALDDMVRSYRQEAQAMHRMPGVAGAPSVGGKGRGGTGAGGRPNAQQTAAEIPGIIRGLQQNMSLVSDFTKRVVATTLGIAGVGSVIGFVSQSIQNAQNTTIGYGDLNQRAFGGDPQALRWQSMGIGYRYGYTGQESLAQANSFTQFGGRYYAQDQNATQRFSRAFGVDANTVAALFGQNRAAGGSLEGQQQKFANMIAYSATQSGMQPRILEVMEAQLAEMNSMNNTLKDHSPTSLMAYQTMMDTIGNTKGMQQLTGQNGANILGALGGAFSNGSNTTWQYAGIRALQNFGGTKYKGMDFFDLQKSVQNGLNNPDLLPAVGKYLKSQTGGMPANQAEAAQVYMMQNLLQSGGYNANLQKSQDLWDATNGFQVFSGNKFNSIMQGLQGQSSTNPNNAINNAYGNYVGSPADAARKAQGAIDQAQQGAGDQALPVYNNIRQSMAQLITDVTNDGLVKGFEEFAQSNPKAAQLVAEVLGGAVALAVARALLGKVVGGAVGALGKSIGSLFGIGRGGRGGGVGGCCCDCAGSPGGGGGGGGGYEGKRGKRAGAPAEEEHLSEGRKFSRSFGLKGGAARVAEEVVMDAAGNLVPTGRKVAHALTPMENALRKSGGFLKAATEGSGGLWGAVKGGASRLGGGALHLLGKTPLGKHIASLGAAAEIMSHVHPNIAGALKVAGHYVGGAFAATARAGSHALEAVGHGFRPGNLLKGAKGFYRVGGKLLSRVPIVGGLIDAGLNHYVGGQGWGQAVTRGAGSAIGGALGGAVGSLLGPAGTIAGAWLGSMAGDWVGNKAYGAYTNYTERMKQEAVARAVQDAAKSQKVDVKSLSKDGQQQLQDLQKKGLISLGQMQKDGSVQITSLSDKGAKALADMQSKGEVSLSSMDKTTQDKLNSINQIHAGLATDLKQTWGDIKGWFQGFFNKPGSSSSSNGNATPGIGSAAAPMSGRYPSIQRQVYNELQKQGKGDWWPFVNNYLVPHESGWKNEVGNDPNDPNNHPEGYFQIKQGTWNDIMGKQWAGDPTDYSAAIQTDAMIRYINKYWGGDPQKIIDYNNNKGYYAGYASGGWIAHDQKARLHANEEVIGKNLTSRVRSRTGKRPSQVLEAYLGGGSGATAGSTALKIDHRITVDVRSSDNSLKGMSLPAVRQVVMDTLNQVDWQNTASQPTRRVR